MSKTTSSKRFFLIVLGLFMTILFFGSKSEWLLVKTTALPDTEGDLYSLCRVKYFKEELPISVPARTLPISDTSTNCYFFGDSFSEKASGYANIVDQLGDSLQRKIRHILPALSDTIFFYPNTFFDYYQIDKRRKKLVIIENVERYLLWYYDLTLSVKDLKKNSDSKTILKDKIRPYYKRWVSNAEFNFEYFFKTNPVMRPVVELKNSFLFDFFGKMSQETKVYALNPPMLFYHETTNPQLRTSFYYNHTDSIIARIANNMTQIVDVMHEYNADVIFVPVPNKYTIYHGFVNQHEYDNFLPRLYTQLADRNVNYVDLYTPFLNQKELLYFNSDSHWNKKGQQIAIEAILAKVRQSRKLY